MKAVAAIARNTFREAIRDRVLYLFLGGDPSQLIEQMPVDSGPSASTSAGPPPPGQDEMVDFVSVVLADTEDTWNPVFASIGRQYEEPHLVLYSGQVRSACGMAGAAMGMAVKTDGADAAACRNGRAGG